MALYLGNSGPVKILLNGIIYDINLSSERPITNGVALLSLNGEYLTDSAGLYITARNSIIENVALSMDNKVLTDSNKIILTIKGE